MFNFDILTRWAQEKPDHLAYVDEDYTLTFVELNSFVRRTAAQLSADGIQAGEIVSVHLPSYLEWTTILALHGLGAVTCTLVDTKKPNQPVKPDWVVGLDAVSNFPGTRTIVFDDAKLEQVKVGTEKISLSGYSQGSDLARLFATSGTTGEIKYLAVTADELEELSNRGGSHDFFGDDPIVSLFPLSAGASYGRALKAVKLGKSYIKCGFSDYKLPKVLLKYSVKTLLGSPIQISSFLDIQTQTGTLLPDLRTIIVSGSVPSEKLLSRIHSQLECEVYDGYGSTEAGNVALRKIDPTSTTGLQLNPAVTLQIVSDEGALLPQGEIGIVRYKRSGMATSYMSNPEATKAAFREGFFYPGDLGSINEKGELLLAGRVNEIINIGGVKINPEIIERLASSQLGVNDCAAFLTPDESGVPQVALAIVTNSDFDSEYFNKVLVNKSPVVPSMIVKVPAIPRNVNGKIDREKLKTLLAL